MDNVYNSETILREEILNKYVYPLPKKIGRWSFEYPSIFYSRWVRPRWTDGYLFFDNKCVCCLSYILKRVRRKPLFNFLMKKYSYLRINKRDKRDLEKVLDVLGY